MEAEQEPTTTMEPILGYYASYFSPREFEIAEILVGLPDVISELDYRPRIRVPWGHKKKRSALAVKDQQQLLLLNKKSSSSTLVRLRVPLSSSSPNPKSKVVQATNVVKVERSSPNTPLSFESEEKPTQFRTKVVVGKRKREEWLEVIQGLESDKELLQKEIQKVKDHKEKLINFNLVLQSREQELKKQRLIQKQPQSQIQEQNLNLDIQLGLSSQPASIPTSIVICAPVATSNVQEPYHQHIAHHRCQMHYVDHTTQTRRALSSENYAYLSSATPVPSTSLPFNCVTAQCNNNGGSILVSDHGVSSDTRRAVFAQRRLMRCQKNRDKRDRVKSSSVAKDNGIPQLQISLQ